MKLFSCKYIFIFFVVGVLASIGIVLAYELNENNLSVNNLTPGNLIEQYEKNITKFKKFEIADKLVYFYQRKIGDAIVEKDFISYQFDKNTQKLLANKTHLRDDLPENLPLLNITKEQAESMVRGEVQFSNLYYISPESDVFPINPTPKNPCWVVQHIDNNKTIITIIDAVTGEKLGNGIPPPYTAFSLSGPVYPDTCSVSWDSWYQNARYWFDAMGYSTESQEWPTAEKIKSHIQSYETALFYEIAHGGSWSFQNSCTDSTIPSEIESWIADYTKMPFTFLGSCDGMCYTNDNTLSYEFRKGSTTNTATVGYCGMSSTSCSDCWVYSISWQNSMFYYMNQSWTVKAAFDQANADYPMCGNNSCMKFAGDENFSIVPVVKRSLELGISNIECQKNNSIWINCSDIKYNDNLTKIRVNCTNYDIGNKNVTWVNITFKNVVKNTTIFNSNASFSSGYWVYDNNDIIMNSGEFSINVTCGNQTNMTKKYVGLSIPFGNLEPYLIYPTKNKSVTRNEFFNFTSGVRCVGGDCGNVNATLNIPNTIFKTVLDDIFVSENQPSNNYNDWPILEVGYYSSKEYRSYLKFNISSINLNKIANITLDIYFSTVNRYYWITIHNVYNNSWNESQVTWNNQPCGTVFNSTYCNSTYEDIVYINTVGWKKFNVKNIINQSISNGVVSFLLKPNNTASGVIDALSKESDIAFVPYLNLTYINLQTGTVPMSNGTPFYTIDNNPTSCGYMKGGDVCEKTWHLNATGDLNWTYQFSTIFNSEYVSNQSKILNITIVENATNNPPVITNFTPENTSFKTREGYEILFNQSSYDPDGDDLIYGWYYDGMQKSNSSSWIFSPNECRNHNIALTVSDYEFLANQSWNITVGLGGDVDWDYDVDIFDLASVGLCYGQSPIGQCENADLNGDNLINIFDLAIVGINYGRYC